MDLDIVTVAHPTESGLSVVYEPPVQLFGPPNAFVNEMLLICRLAWPTSISILFHYLVQPISLMFCGRLGRDELAAAAMALSVINITVVSVGRGLAFAGDTFFSQTYGSTNKFGVGVYLQKALIFSVLCSCIVSAFLVNTETILLLCRQDPQVARMAQVYTETFLPGVFAYSWAFIMMRYLICQNKVVPNALVCALGCGSNALLHYLLIDIAQLELRGSAISLAVTYYIVLLLLVMYVVLTGFHRTTWAGWTWQCMLDWGTFSWIAIPSIIMTFLYWLSTEIGTFLAGLFGVDEISAFAICFQVEGVAWVIPLGIGSACTTRIGQLLGAREPRHAVMTCKVTLACQVILSVAMAMLCCSCRHYIPLAFTKDRSVIELTAELLPFVSTFLLLEGCGGIGVSIIRGTGRQTMGALILFVSYYVIALPVGIALMFTTSLRITGLWLGFILGLALMDVCLLCFLLRLDWDDEANDAQIRAGMVADNPQIRRVTETASGLRDPIFHGSSSTDESSNLLTSYQQPASELLGSYYYQSLDSIRDEEASASSRRRTRTIGRRLFIVVVVCVILAAGLTCRFTIAHHPDDGGNSTVPWHNVSAVYVWSDRDDGLFRTPPMDERLVYSTHCAGTDCLPDD